MTTQDRNLLQCSRFGPALPVIRCSDVEEAVAAANDRPNGLGGSVWIVHENPLNANGVWNGQIGGAITRITSGQQVVRSLAGSRID